MTSFQGRATMQQYRIWQKCASYIIVVSLYLSPSCYSNVCSSSCVHIWQIICHECQKQSQTKLKKTRAPLAGNVNTLSDNEEINYYSFLGHKFYTKIILGNFFDDFCIFLRQKCWYLIGDYRYLELYFIAVRYTIMLNTHFNRYQIILQNI